ncbi:MAG: MCE family protein [Alphaproteobacteria bacterium]|nr:MCE family protein [Alphaproteobacteria bacterium]
MKREPNKRLVGLFLITGILIFAFLIGQVAWSKYISLKKNIFVMYFDESLQGLNEGAPIVFQGVEVGKVAEIKIVANENNLKFRVPVYGHFKSAGALTYGSNLDSFQSKPELLEMLINRGLRARLVVQSYLTGQLMIELVMLPNSENKVVPDEENEKVPQIPTVLSKAGVIAKGLDSFKGQEIIDRLNHVWSVFEREVPLLLPALTSGITTLNKILSQVSVKSGETINNMNKTMQDISDAARSFQNLTEYLEQHPESLLAGKKGE